MKKFLGLIFSLLSVINLSAESLEWYKNSKLTREEEHLELKKNNEHDLKNVAIVEYLLLKHQALLKANSIDYKYLAESNLTAKQSALRSILSMLIHIAPTASSTAAKKPATLPLPPASVKKSATLSATGIRKYIDLVTSSASNEDIKSALSQNSASDFKNVVIVEYLLKAKFNVITKNLNTQNFKQKQDLLNSFLTSAPVSAGAGGSPTPLAPAEAAPKPTAVLSAAAKDALSEELQALLLEKVITQEEAILLNKDTTTAAKDAVNKYARLLKMGQSAEQLRLRMQAENLISIPSPKPFGKPVNPPVTVTSKPASPSSISTVPTGSKPAFLSEISTAKLNPVTQTGGTPAPAAPKPAASSLSPMEEMKAKLAQRKASKTAEDTIESTGALNPPNPAVSAPKSTPKPATSVAAPSPFAMPDLAAPKTNPASSASNPTSISPTAPPAGQPMDLMAAIRANKAGKTGGASSHPVTTSATVAAGGPSESVSAPVSADPLQKYKDMIRKRASDGEILQALMYPEPITLTDDPATGKKIIVFDKETIDNLQKLIPIESKQDINNMDILDYLLKTKYSQPQETLNRMFPYFKIIDIKRHLIFGQRLDARARGLKKMEIPRGGVYGENPNNKKRTRETIFSKRNWIEFPSPNIDDPLVKRHLDYSTDSESSTVYLLNSNRWNTGIDDYSHIASYPDVNNYYWSPDGKFFTLVYNDDTSQSYEWINGWTVSNRTKLPEEEVIVFEPDDSKEDPDEHEAASTEPVTTSPKTAKQLLILQPGETEIHFRARLLAKLNVQGGKYSITSQATALANAVLSLDKTFIGLSDEDLNTLFELDEYLNEGALSAIITKNPNDASLLEKAKVYIAIHTGALKEGDPGVNIWANTLEEIALQSAGVEDQGGKVTIKFLPGISTNNDNLVQTFARFTSLTNDQRNILEKPNKYLRSIGRLLRKVPDGDSSVTDLDRAKIYLTLLSHWIDLDAEENSANLDNIKKWKRYFGLDY